MTTKPIVFAPFHNPQKVIEDDLASIREIAYLTTPMYCYEVLYTEEQHGDFISIIVYEAKTEDDDGCIILLDDYEFKGENRIRAYRCTEPVPESDLSFEDEARYTGAAMMCIVQDMQKHTA